MGINIIFCIAALLCSLVITTALCPLIIPKLLKLKIGNTEREELKSHQIKNGTPSMGGIMFLTGITVSVLLAFYYYKETLPVLFLMLGFGVIGFLDDYIKTVKKRSDGFKPKQKMLLEIIVTIAFLFLVSSRDLTMIIPFFNGFRLDLGILTYPVLFLAILGTMNGVNFTDGVDGLASTVTVVVSLFFGACAYTLGRGTVIICAAVIGALLGFLLFNAYPAKVFMGDTGSLALGGFVAGTAILLNLTIFILIVGLIYWIEILSVMIQVTYFKKTGGKRIFRMAPIHHHFELGGWSEVRVVTVFSVFTVVMGLIGYIGFLLGM